MSKSKVTTSKKQLRKRAVKPGIDLNKAEKLVDKLIADGTIQRQAKEMAKDLEDRLAATRTNREEQAKQAATAKDEKEKFAESVQEQAHAAMKEYVTLANQSRRTSSNITIDVLGFFDYDNLIDNVDYYYVNVPLKVLCAMSNPEVIEPLKKEIGNMWVKTFIEILERLIVFTHQIKGNDASIAELEAINFDMDDYSEKGIEHLLIKKSEYETKITHLKEKLAVWKAYDEAHDQ